MRVRLSLVERTDLTDEAQCVLAKDPDNMVRVFLANNRTLNTATQWTLGQDSVAIVRENLVYRARDLPLQEKLSYDPQWDVLGALSTNEHVQVNEGFSLRYWRSFQGDALAARLAGEVISPEWEGLMEGWEGSLSGFLEAVGLLTTP